MERGILPTVIKDEYYNAIIFVNFSILPVNDCFDFHTKLVCFFSILNSYANMHRKYLLKFLGKSSEIIHCLCETKGLFKTYEMIEQVTTWWP